VLGLPAEAYDPVVTRKYQARMYPNARLAGLVRTGAENKLHELEPLLFTEVSLPKAPAGSTPRLHGRISPRRWVFTWDARRRCGYLLVVPPSKDLRKLHFDVQW